MSHTRTGSKVSYDWSQGRCTNRLSIEINETVGVPAAGSHGEFIIEHYWGYTRRGETLTDEYKVAHPKWELFSVKNEIIDVHFGKTYGGEFAFLSDTEPSSVLLAKGSEVAIYRGERIK